jgi:hypothetical protein
VGHCLELADVYGVGQEVGELVEMLVGGEGPCGFEETKFGGI